MLPYISILDVFSHSKIQSDDDHLHSVAYESIDRETSSLHIHHITACSHNV